MARVTSFCHLNKIVASLALAIRQVHPLFVVLQELGLVAKPW